jgi:predicted TIM-barrel fold metal-dependent hydrolase
MPQLTSYPIFDSDQHYYEPRDSFTRFIEPKYRDRTIRPVRLAGGTEVLMADDERIRLDSPNFDEVVRPGSLRELLRAVKKGGKVEESAHYMPMDPAFQDRDKRIARMDEQGVEATMMYCNNAIMAEAYLQDTDLLYASLRSFNRWQEETWGFNYRGRIITAAMMSLRDVDQACLLLDDVLRRGARAIVFTPGPQGGKSPAHPDFDPFWARVDEARMVVGYHITETGYTEQRSAAWSYNTKPTFYTQSAWQWMFCYGTQPIQETLGALIYDNLFGRFPNIRVLVAEYGIEWVPLFLRQLDKNRGMGRGGPWIGGELTDRPSEIFKRHIRLHPFWEDDIAGVVEAVGTADIVVGGSDYPHSEGLAEPTQLVEHVRELDPAVQRAIMRDNGLALVGLA